MGDSAAHVVNQRVTLLRDQLLEHSKGLFREVLHESIRQIDKWGIQEHTPFEWMTYITEEVGELAQAISEYEYRDGPRNNIVQEAVQVATLALKVAEMYGGGRD